MVDKQEYIEKYKQLQLSKTGRFITDEEALAHFTNLVTLVSAVYRPIDLGVFENNQCPSCLEKINYDDFEEDIKTIHEYLISGLCAKCQDEIFK